MIDFGASSILFVFGLLFGVLSLIYFAKDILVSLSVTTKLVSIFTVAVILFVVSLFIQSSALSIILLLLSSVSYTVSVLYSWNKYTNKNLRLLVLIVSSVLFIGLGIMFQNGLIEPNRLVFYALSGVIVAVFLSLFILDLREDSPVKYELDLEEQVKNFDERIKIGDIKVSNEGRLRRHSNTPKIMSYYKFEDKEVKVPCQVVHKNANDIISGGETSRYDLKIDTRAIKKEYESREQDIPEEVIVINSRPDEDEQSVPKMYVNLND